ncbi:MAG TPA: TrkH family potassium uptake protein [Prolixibacteraceae bacterium]|nr:TrkH family potassium uptake protein [Prolixibacteraceae bacterium]HOS89475.1 TrkH family potassium uptake protein [Prolixibacteraceae bacterium]HQH75353.1 TrkH family potassium uptake protein [Prolixibacteraceae bacterium]HQJ84954.1 TrkH family potassium uptake protein [Prolixibacteraceae bacterium]
MLLVEGAALLISLLIAWLAGGSDVMAFAWSSLTCLVPGLLLVMATRKSSMMISRTEGFLIVTLVWLIFSLFGTLPYIFSRTIPGFADAFFETMSGFTTTGASVVDNLETFPKGILFWRALTHWLGGMGIIVLFLTMMPAFGIGGMQLYSAEVPGMTVEKISPRIYQTARIVWGVYVLLTLVEVVLLMFGGMSLFDSVCHAFATMATGGFSTKQASIAFWPSPYIQYVITLFMFLAGTNFTLLYFAGRGKFSRLFRDEEFRYYFLFVLGFTILIFSGLLISTKLPAEQAFRDSLFTVVSVITTTGFVTADYLMWRPVLYMLVFILFFFGGSTGSTGGGVKIMRIVLLLKNSYYELRRIIHPSGVIPVKFNKHAIEPRVISNVLAFFMFYLMVFFVSTVILMIFVGDMDTSMGAVASCLGNIGPGLGSVGPVFTYSAVPDAGKVFLSLLMMLGRLELFTVLVIFSPSFWTDQ